MEIKEAIKTTLLSGISMEVSYKGEISSWYSQIKIYEYDGKYTVDHTDFYDIDEAVNYFITKCFSKGNVGYIQERLVKKGLLSDEVDLEDPTDEVIELFEQEGKLVDEEFQKMDIVVKPFPKVGDADDDVRKLSEISDPIEFAKNVKDILNKYSVIDVRLSLMFSYSSDKIKGYSRSLRNKDLINLNEEILKEYIEFDGGENHNMKISTIQISYSINNEHQFMNSELINYNNNG